ncbi:hypothetical protein KCU93_g43, partial [Aureobasidium melanogenum]
MVPKFHGGLRSQLLFMSAYCFGLPSREPIRLIKCPVGVLRITRCEPSARMTSLALIVESLSSGFGSLGATCVLCGFTFFAGFDCIVVSHHETQLLWKMDFLLSCSKKRVSFLSSSTISFGLLAPESSSPSSPDCSSSSSAGAPNVVIPVLVLEPMTPGVPLLAKLVNLEPPPRPPKPPPKPLPSFPKPEAPEPKVEEPALAKGEAVEARPPKALVVGAGLAPSSPGAGVLPGLAKLERVLFWPSVPKADVEEPASAPKADEAKALVVDEGFSVGDLVVAREAKGEDAEVFAKPLPAGILVVGLGCCAGSSAIFPSDSMVAFASDVVSVCFGCSGSRGRWRRRLRCVHRYWLVISFEFTRLALARLFNNLVLNIFVAVAVVSADCGTLLMVAFLNLSLRGLSPPSVSEACDSLGDVGILVAKVVEAARSDEAAQSVSVDTAMRTRWWRRKFNRLVS